MKWKRVRIRRLSRWPIAGDNLDKGVRHLLFVGETKASDGDARKTRRIVVASPVNAYGAIALL